MCELADGTTRNLSSDEKRDLDNLPEGARLFRRMRIDSSGAVAGDRRATFFFHPESKPCPAHRRAWSQHSCSRACDGQDNDCPKGKKCGPRCKAIQYSCPTNRHWSISLRGLQLVGSLNRLESGTEGFLSWKRYEDEVPGRYINAIWENTPGNTNKQYVVETPPKVLERCLLMTTDPGDLVLDLTCGSGAMPFQAETWGRRWIAIDVAQVSIAIARERILTSTYPYHLLKDSPDGDKLDHEMEQELLPRKKRDPFAPKGSYGNDPAKGFVTERQMRVSAATLAYGYDDEEPIRHPDRTIKDTNKARVASPFTVESDSPYRSVALGESPDPGQELDVETVLQNQGFNINGHQEPDPVTDRITSNLETAGIGQPGQGRYKVENLAASEIPDVTHTGTLVDPNGERHPAYFYIGREDEGHLIGPDQERSIRGGQYRPHLQACGHGGVRPGWRRALRREVPTEHDDPPGGDQPGPPTSLAKGRQDGFGLHHHQRARGETPQATRWEDPPGSGRSERLQPQDRGGGTTERQAGDGHHGGHRVRHPVLPGPPDERPAGEEEPEDNPQSAGCSPAGDRRREVGADAVDHDRPLRATAAGRQDRRQGHRPDRHGAHDGHRRPANFHPRLTPTFEIGPTL